MNSVGFTGTRHGMTDAQKKTFKQVVRKLRFKTFHHGDCVGADAEAHAIVLSAFENASTYIYIVKHPPENSKFWADCQSFWASRPFKPYLQRNRDIVDESDILIAAPSTANERQRSGTWATVRYARSQGKLVFLILPDGLLQ